MINFGERTWEGAMRHAHAAIVASERLYEEINAPEGRSNIDMEKHLRRSEVKAAHAQAGTGDQLPRRPPLRSRNAMNGPRNRLL